MIDPTLLENAMTALDAVSTAPSWTSWTNVRTAIASVVPMLGAYYAFALVHREGVNGLPDGRCHCAACRACASHETLLRRLRYPGSRKHKRALKRLGLRVTRMETPNALRTGPPCHFCGQKTVPSGPHDKCWTLCPSRAAVKYGGWCSPETEWVSADSVKTVDAESVGTGEVP